MRVVGYARVSTAEQGDSGAGLAAQRAAIEAWCTYKGVGLIRIEDEVASGKTTSGRHGLERALAAVENGDADVLAVAKLDRLSRSVGDFASLVDRSRGQGWRLVALDVDIDTTTANGEMVAHLLATLSQWERRIIGERTKAALATKKAAGETLGRRPTLDAEVRRRIVRERRAGSTYREITRRLNAERVPTAQGGKAWHVTTVRRIVLSAERILAAERGTAAKPRTKPAKVTT